MGTPVTLTVALVTVGGKIDFDASTSVFQTALETKQEAMDAENAGLAEAVEEILDEAKGAPLDMPTLGSLVATKLNAPHSIHAVLAERARDYVRANSQGKVVDKVEQFPESRFVIGRGKGGGAMRRADRKPAS